MGDILHAMPAVTALRRSHPDWFLGWAVEPRWQPLFRDAGGGMPLIDRMHLANAKAWARSPVSRQTFHEIGELRRELHAERYDVCVDLQGAVRSGLLARAAGAPRIVGEARPREPLARWLFHERISTRGTHVIEQAIEVCNAIAGDRLEPTLPVFPADPESEAWAKSLLIDKIGAANGPVVLLSPGAGWGAKRWPPERYGQLAAKLDAAGCRVLVNVGPEERAIAGAVLEAARAAPGAEQLGVTAPEFSLSRLIAVTRRASLVIAGDTGPLHLACALGKPVVGIFGPTDPKRNGPFGVPFRVLRHPESKRDHARRAAPEAGLLTILPDQVFAAAMDLLQRGA